MIINVATATKGNSSRTASLINRLVRRSWLLAMLLLVAPPCSHAQLRSSKHYSTPSSQGKPLWEAVLIDDMAVEGPIALKLQSGTKIPDSAREHIRKINEILRSKLHTSDKRRRLECYTSPDGRSLMVVGISTSIKLSDKKQVGIQQEVYFFPDWTKPSEYRFFSDSSGARFLSNDLVLVTGAESMPTSQMSDNAIRRTPRIISRQDPDMNWTTDVSYGFDSMRDDGRVTTSGGVLIIGQMSEEGRTRIAIVHPDDLSEDGLKIETYGWLHDGTMLAVIVRDKDGEGKVYLLTDEGKLIAKLNNRIRTGYGAIGDDMLHYATEGQQYLAKVEKDGTSRTRRVWSGPSVLRQRQLYGRMGQQRITTQRMKVISPSGAQIADLSHDNLSWHYGKPKWVKVSPTGRERKRPRQFQVDKALLAGWLAVWPDPNQKNPPSPVP